MTGKPRARMILKGTKPADLPLDSSNLKTAKALGFRSQCSCERTR